jgi:hypothetical protein
MGSLEGGGYDVMLIVRRTFTSGASVEVAHQWMDGARATPPWITASDAPATLRT